MTDLLQVLPDFDTRPYSHLLPSLDKALITTNDLLTLEPAEVAKRAQVPVGELKKLLDVTVKELHRGIGVGEGNSSNDRFLAAAKEPDSGWRRISTLDEELDAALGGGIPPGHLVEITGESGAGKTQLLLTLLLASQLPPPHGLSKSAIYVSTEAPLATKRLTQLLTAHPALASLAPDEKPSLSRILSIQVPDLESQEHILRYQLPVAVEKHGVGLVILDSVAANYRAEFEKKGERDGGASMAKRGNQVVQLGSLLRNLARTKGIAVVVANQVADRFTRPPPSNSVSRTTSANSQGSITSTVNTPPLSLGAEPTQSNTEEVVVISPDPLALDHQQRWFTGWGDIRSDPAPSLKTPSLGLVWTNQIACRIALLKKPVYASRALVVNVNGEDQFNDEERHISKWRRWLKVVFSSWAAPSEGRGVEFEILRSGLRHIQKKPLDSN